MSKLPIQSFRLKHGYSFDEDLRVPSFQNNNVIVGLTAPTDEPDALFIGKVAEFENMRTNAWLDLQGAHAIYVMGKRRSGKSFTLGTIAEGMISAQWLHRGSQQQALLLLDTMNIFSTMLYSVDEVFGADSVEAKELKRWGLTREAINLHFFYPRGTEAPPEGPSTELTLRASDLSAEDWASLFGVDTYRDPIGQLISDLYDTVALEGYVSSSGEEVSPNPHYAIVDLLRGLDENPQVSRFESRTIEAVRRRLKAINRLPVFSEAGLDIKELFVPARVSIVLLRDLEQNMRGLLIGTLTKKIMEQRSLADRYERLAEIYAKKCETHKDNGPAKAQAAQDKYNEYSERAKEGLTRGWIVIDEAHNYLPSKGLIASREPLKKYVNEGRNLGLSIVVATQQPSGLDPAIQRNADVLMIHSMSMADDIQTAERMVNTFVPESVVYDNKEKISTRVFEKMVRSLDVGYALISNDRANRVFAVKVRPRFTVHGGIDY